MRRICSGCRDGADFPVDIAMAFQPIVDTTSGTAFAYEALLREADGSSAQSVLARVNGDNRYSFDQACRVKAIEAAVLAGILETDAYLSINFLPDAVYSPLACIQLTLATAHATQMPVNRLIFEFIESEHMSSPEHVSRIIDTYKEVGFKVAIDDFGAGHSGLNMFARFATDEIKLDMELSRGVDRDPRRQAIIKGIVGMCHDLGAILVAEGVETPEEAETLCDLGVRYHQGYFYARPLLGRLPAISDYARGACLR